ncbi:MAG: BamA/TamA family outer membrane protein [Deltaproteobacteria bacterium]|nr:BamA/TamA family outer membrane protein [Deltaproteobacteria bacterium]
MFGLLQFPTFISAAALSIAMIFAAPVAEAATIMKFTGVSVAQGRALQSKFPFVFERPISLAEADEVVRFLMKTGLYSNIEVVSRVVDGDPELLLVATALRKIKGITVGGNRAMSNSEVLQVLQLQEGKVFERKELIESIKNLQTEYRRRGYRGMNAEVDFETPNESEVELKVKVEEGIPTIVERVQIDSANPEVVRRIDRIIKPLKGKALSEDDLQKLTKEIAEDLRSNRFLTARTLDPQAVFDEQQSRVRIAITIESAWKYLFKFEGNLALDDSALIRQMNLEQLVGTVTTPAPELAERLRRAYQTSGFAHIEVSATEKTIEESFIKEITFKIDEGPRVRVKRIEITGNISRQGSYYAEFIESSSRDLIGEGYYNRKDIEDGIRSLEEELQNQGYLRAKVKSWRSEFSNPQLSSATSARDQVDTGQNMAATKSAGKRGSQATLILNIDEGPLTVIRQIRFEGVEAFSKIQLQGILPIKTSESLRIKDLNDAIEALKSYYYSQGFIEMRILNEKEGLVTYNESSTQATVEFQVYEGPKVTVSSIVLDGNVMTKDYVILRELSIKQGDVFTPELRDDSIFHLQRLSLFSRVNVRTLEEGTSIAERTVIVEVEESAPGTFESGVGVAYDRDLLFRGYAGIAYRNLQGTGRAASIRADPSYSTDPKISYLEYKITLSYLEPYILRDRNKGRLNLVRDVGFKEVDSDGKAIILAKNEIGLNLERDLTKHLKLTYTAYNLSSQSEFDRSNPDEIKRTQNIAKTGPQIEYDTRDNVFYPTKGLYAQIGFEYADPILGSSEDASQSIKFSKVTASVSVPYRIFGSPNFIFASSVRSGYLANLSTLPQGGVPDQEAFFLGGRSTLRGFQPTGRSLDLERVPNLTQLGKANLRDFYVTTDSYYYLLKAEIRFPVYGDFHGALFYDGGAVLLSQIFLEDSYRDSFGVALRYKVSGGIVAGLEYGKKLNRKNWHPYGYESPEAWHFSIGTF